MQQKVTRKIVCLSVCPYVSETVYVLYSAHIATDNYINVNVHVNVKVIVLANLNTTTTHLSLRLDDSNYIYLFIYKCIAAHQSAKAADISTRQRTFERLAALRTDAATLK